MSPLNDDRMRDTVEVVTLAGTFIVDYDECVDRGLLDARATQGGRLDHLSMYIAAGALLLDEKHTTIIIEPAHIIAYRCVRRKKETWQ